MHCEGEGGGGESTLILPLSYALVCVTQVESRFVHMQGVTHVLHLHLHYVYFSSHYDSVKVSLEQ